MVDIINLLWTNKDWIFSGIGVAVVLGVIGGLGWIIRAIYQWLHKQNNTEPKQIQITGDNSTSYQIGGNSTVNTYFGGKENGK